MFLSEQCALWQCVCVCPKDLKKPVGWKHAVSRRSAENWLFLYDRHGTFLFSPKTFFIVNIKKNGLFAGMLGAKEMEQIFFF